MTEHIKHVSICLLYLLISLNVAGQTITNSIISSAGSDYNNEIGKIQWTLGEIAISAKSSNSNLILEGFHALMLNNDISTNIPTIKHLRHFEVFPNPTKGIVNINISTITEEIKSLFVIDVNGVIILEKDGLPNQVDLDPIPTGMYYLMMIDKENNGYLAKVVKE